MKTRSLLTSFTSCALLAAGLARADSPDPEPVKLQNYEVHDRSEDPLSILPARPTDSIFGTTESLLETPRSVSVLESDLLAQYGVQTVNDFVAVTAGTFTGNYFGVHGALEVRGGEADNFFRGFRRVQNLGNFPTVISSSDYVEIIKGPPPPVYDAGSVGGILNFVPKTARSETAKLITEPEGKLTVTGGTYSKRLVTGEYGAPFKFFGRKAGYYAFVSDEDSKSYFDNIYNKDFLGQLAVNVELSPTVDLEFGGMYQHANLNQSLGWNRVTQNLIDHGQYLSGAPLVNVAKPGEAGISANDVFPGQLLAFAFAPNYFAPIFLSPAYGYQNYLFALDPATVKTVQLSPHQIQAEASDFAKTDSPTAYFDVVAHLGAESTLKNQTFADSMNHLKYSSYGFAARYKEFVFENRTTYDGSFRLGDSVKVKDSAGFAFRYTDGDEAEGRDILQVENRRDISVGATPNTRFLPAYDGGFGYNWRQIGASGDVGAFAMLEATFWDRATITLAGRKDRMQAHTLGTDFNGVFSRGDSSDDGFTTNLSAEYRITPGLIPYVTFARARYVDLGQGGMLPAPEIEGGSWMQPSALDEVGVKYSGMGGKLYATLAAYRQKKSDYDSLTNTFDFYHARGVESELRFAPDKHWAITGAATWQRTEILSPPFFNSLPPAVLGFTDPSLAYGGNFNGTGSLLGLTGPLRVPRPARVFSLFGTYLSEAGVGVSFGATYVPSYYAGYFQQVLLPSYVVCRAGLSYKIDRHWSTTLQVNNLFNQRYYLPQYLFQDVFISPGEGTTAQFMLAYKW